MNPIIEIAIIRGTAAIMSASNGTKSKITLSRMGPTLSSPRRKILINLFYFRVPALAYWTSPISDTEVMASFILALARTPFTFSFMVSKIDINSPFVHTIYKSLVWFTSVDSAKFLKNYECVGWCAFWVGCCTEVMKVLLVLVLWNRNNSQNVTTYN